MGRKSPGTALSPAGNAGKGRTFTFEVVEQAAKLTLGGARLVATNLDPNRPTALGNRPGCGAIHG